MGKKTFAMIDLAGLGDELRAGTAEPRIQQFWKLADAWTNSVASGINVRLRGRNASENARVRVSAFSDSLLLSTDVEYELADFFKVVTSLLDRLVAQVGPAYCIVGSGDHINPPTLPALGGFETDGDMRPRFVQIAGTGPAFADLFNAEYAVRKRKDWHEAGYRLYAIDDAIEDGVASLAQCTFTDLMGKQRTIHVIK